MVTARSQYEDPTAVYDGAVEGISHDGRGVVRADGKAVFVDGVLPGERVRFRRTRRRRSSDVAELLEIHDASPFRVQPRCSYFGVCGGCALQHLEYSAQVQTKQDMVLETLRRVGRVTPENVLPPLSTEPWGYRRKARLGVRFVPKKGGVLVGFREKRSSYVTPISTCDVLHPRVATLLPELQRLIAGLNAAQRIPQVEVAVGDNAVALVLRHLVELDEHDTPVLLKFAQDHTVQLHLQPCGLDSVYCLWPNQAPPLYYRVKDQSIKIEFRPTDFIQINGVLNEQLVNQAVALVEPQSGETVLDLFCGLGNFSLPLAKSDVAVLGVEGDAGLVARAQHNARINGQSNVRFIQSDLYAEKFHGQWFRCRYDKVLLDPPRSGAMEVVKLMTVLRPGRMVYISCNPATLARDSEVIVHKHGYVLQHVGIVDMFPHTHHAECIAVFEAT
ncbi:MAG: 23S rRNA (uracil(1939)-C(5))-methyltransferase RlmD [Gammaproteobacteria bacterium]|nr:23S rRNA (uracil(1939)-C(5))-methyltransferase RlmD [Gammaproteobacteria bacterium]